MMRMIPTALLWLFCSALDVLDTKFAAFERGNHPPLQLNLGTGWIKAR